jgi:hypothetical protein
MQLQLTLLVPQAWISSLVVGRGKARGREISIV